LLTRFYEINSGRITIDGHQKWFAQ
jgi:ABC-type multidrug transport system fused ATPase/permease subunit